MDYNLTDTQVTNIARHLVGKTVRSKKEISNTALVLGTTKKGVYLLNTHISWDILFDSYEDLDGQTLKMRGPFGDF